MENAWTGGTGGRALERTYVRMFGWPAGSQRCSAGSFSQARRYPPARRGSTTRTRPPSAALHLATRRDLPGIHIAAKGIEPLGLGNLLVELIYFVVSGDTRKKHPSRRVESERGSTFG